MTPRAVRHKLKSPRIARGSNSTTWALGHGPESTGTPGRQHESSGTVPSHPGQLVHISGHRTRPQVSGEAWSTPRGLGYSPESPGTPGRHRGPSEQGPSHPGHLVDRAGHWARAQVTQESWSSPRDIGHSPDLPGTAGRPRVFGPGPEFPGATGRHRWPSDQCPSHPVELVDPARPSDLARVAQDSW